MQLTIIDGVHILYYVENPSLLVKSYAGMLGNGVILGNPTERRNGLYRCLPTDVTGNQLMMHAKMSNGASIEESM